MIFFVSACMSIGTVAVALGIGNVLGQLCLNIFTNMNNIFIISLALLGYFWNEFSDDTNGDLVVVSKSFDDGCYRAWL